MSEPSPEQLASLQLDNAQLPIYDLAAFNGAELDRVTSFATSEEEVDRFGALIS